MSASTSAQLEYRRQYYVKNRGAILAKRREHYYGNTDKVRESQRKYASANRNARRAYQKQYRAAHSVSLNSARQQERRNDPRSQMLKHAKANAKNKGVPFALTKEDLFVPKVCPVLGMQLRVGDGKRTDASPSLDRAVPALGYIVGNVRVISWRANNVKSDATADELRAVLKYMEQSTWL